MADVIIVPLAPTPVTPTPGGGGGTPTLPGPTNAVPLVGGGHVDPESTGKVLVSGGAGNAPVFTDAPTVSKLVFPDGTEVWIEAFFDANGNRTRRLMVKDVNFGGELVPLAERTD